MITDLPVFADYKHSGVDWLGRVPKHWEIVPGRACFDEVYRSNRGMVESTVLSLSYGRIVIKPPEKLHGLVPASFETYQVIEPGDIIVRPTDLQNDWNTLRTAMSPHRGIITSAYMCLHTRSALRSEFGDRLLRTYDLMKIFYGLGSGLRQNLSWDDFKYLPCVLPPPEEQTSIVRFLAEADRRINRLIRNKRRLIELLNEQKQAIITQAVTRGLDPSVPVKASGVDWLGQIPVHWEVLSLRRRWSVRDCKHLTVPFTEGGIPLASVREVQHFDLKLVAAKRTSPEWAAILREGGRYPRPGDLVYCRNVSVGAAAVVGEQDDCAMGQDVCLIRSDHQNQRFLNYYLCSHPMRVQLQLLLVGSTFNRINVEEIKGLVVVVPPRAEQNAICQYLDDRLLEIDRMIDDAQQEIALIREYRTRLIADVVTGKLDVRAAAADLPELDDAEREPEEGLEVDAGLGVSERELEEEVSA